MIHFDMYGTIADLKKIKTVAGRWVAKLVAHLLATAPLWIRIQTSFKNTKMGNISKGVTNTL
jgi:hypothetical protein